MKHRGPGSSLHPAREAARTQARAATNPRPPRGTAAGLPRIGDWVLDTGPAGELVAVHEPTGERTVLATPPAEGS
jgi:hypothetical protein